VSGRATTVVAAAITIALCATTVLTLAAGAAAGAASTSAAPWSAPRATAPASMAAASAAAATGDDRSTNWSGIADTGLAFTSVGATWSVPAVTRPTVHGRKVAGDSATWVGIGGDVAPDTSVVQAGTEQDATASGGRYHAWFELLPSAPVTIAKPVHPGDVLTVAIVETAPAEHAWSITVTDATQGWVFQHTTEYASSNASAEWIEEAPSIRGTVSPLAGFGAVTFSHLQVNGVAALAPAGATPDRIDLVTASGKVGAYPEGYVAAANAFAVRDGAPTPLVAAAGTLPEGRAGSPYLAASPASGGITPYAFSAHGAWPSWLSVNPGTGALTGTPPTAATSTSATVEVAVRDAVGATAIATLHLTVLATTFALTQSSPAKASATAGTAWHGQLAVAQPSGLTGPVQFTAAGASAFTLTASGVLALARTTPPGTYTAGGTDGDVHGDAGTWSITVVVARPAHVVIATTSLPGATAGAAYDVQLVAFAPAGTIRWSALSGLPKGLALSATGVLKGVAVAAATGTHHLKVQATASGSSATRTLTLVVVTAAA
jgi:hypothetical protein